MVKVNLGKVVGNSAYEVWLSVGNKGTEQQYIASLKGVKGDKGDKGEQGDQGLKGDKGEQGDLTIEDINKASDELLKVIDEGLFVGYEVHDYTYNEDETDTIVKNKNFGVGGKHNYLEAVDTTYDIMKSGFLIVNSIYNEEVADTLVKEDILEVCGARKYNENKLLETRIESLIKRIEYLEQQKLGGTNENNSL